MNKEGADADGFFFLFFFREELRRGGPSRGVAWRLASPNRQPDALLCPVLWARACWTLVRSRAGEGGEITTARLVVTPRRVTRFAPRGTASRARATCRLTTLTHAHRPSPIGAGERNRRRRTLVFVWRKQTHVGRFLPLGILFYLNI